MIYNTKAFKRMLSFGNICLGLSLFQVIIGWIAFDV